MGTTNCADDPQFGLVVPTISSSYVGTTYANPLPMLLVMSSSTETPVSPSMVAVSTGTVVNFVALNQTAYAFGVANATAGLLYVTFAADQVKHESSGEGNVMSNQFLITIGALLCRACRPCHVSGWHDLGG